MRVLVASVTGNALLAIAACQPGAQSPVAQPDSSQLQRQITELRKTIAGQAVSLASHSSDIELLKLQLGWIQNKAIVLDLSTPAYQCIDTNTGKFLISCDNVQAYADGQKLTLRIGNPTLITFTGFTLKAKWGVKAPFYNQQETAYAAWQIAYANWQRSLHEREIDSAAALKPGLWNTVEVILSPARVEELGYVELSMTTNTVGLVRDKAR